MRGRRGTAAGLPEHLRELILAVVVILVLLVITYQGIMIMGSPATAGACKIQTLAHSVVRVGGFAYIDWDCPIKGPIRITADDLNRVPNWNMIPESTIHSYGGRDKILEILPIYNTQQIIADELAECWDKIGQGNAELFDRHWRLRGVDLENLTQRTKNGQQYVDPIVGCGLCSVLYFDDAALSLLPDPSGYIRMNDFLKYHPVNLRSLESYYEFIDPPHFQDTTALIEPVIAFTPQSMSDPLVVLFVRVPKGHVEALSNLGSGVLVGGGVFTLLGLMRQPQVTMFKNIIRLGRGGALIGAGAATGGVSSQGITALQVVRMSQAREHCSFIANSFRDDTLLEVWGYG